MYWQTAFFFGLSMTTRTSRLWTAWFESMPPNRMIYVSLYYVVA